MDETFTYKPALLADRKTVTVSDEGITVASPGRSDSLAWSAVQSARYWAMGVKQHAFQGIDLKGSDGRLMKIHLTSPAHGYDPEMDSFFKILGACLTALGTHRPDVEIHLGQRKSSLWAMFSIGVICLLFAVAIPMVALAMDKNVSLERGGAPIAVMLLFGGMIAWQFHPFQKPLSLAAKDVLKLVESAKQSDDTKPQET
ncbi:MAG: hypothetical protein CMK07_08465 [Ponticaulis sp.]|nr:hypothetical protein [Ponticaulis sp.]